MALTRVGRWAALTISLIGMLGFANTYATSPPILAVPPGLSIAEIKITGSEFVMLYNNTGSTITDLSSYWIYDFNNVNPLASGVSSSSQQLPTTSLADGQTLLLSANGGSTCGAAVTAKLSISLTDSGGFIEVVQQSLASGVLLQTAGDSLSWSSGANSTPGMIASVPSNSSAPDAAYYRYQNSSPSPPFLWQRADVSPTNSCQLNVTIAGTPTPGPVNPGNQLLPGVPPPAQIITLASQLAPVASLPATDIGLSSPVVNEILPNPASPVSDANGEFIELYNSNPVSFDMSGFVLATGTKATHKYTFPAGVKLGPKSFTAFSLKGTGLSLSNSGGQVQLFDPLGNLISKTDIYTTAKDGQAWALANGKWYWTNKPTPSAENLVNQAAIGDGKGSSLPQILGANSTSQDARAGQSSSNRSANAAAPLHPWTLAAVGALAVGYGLYEYRTDLANRFYQLQRYREARAAAGQAPGGRRSIGTIGRLGGWQDNLRSRPSSRRKK